MDRSERLTQALGEYAKELSNANSNGMLLAKNRIINIFEECIPEKINGECWNDCIDEMMHEIDNLREVL